MLTTAVFAICLTAPLGAILINTLGTKWLTYDGPSDSWVTDKQDIELSAGSGNAVTPIDELTAEKAKGVTTARGGHDDALVVKDFDDNDHD